VARAGELLDQARQELAQLLETPQIADDGWKREVATQVLAVHLIHQELTDMAVPVEMIGVHSALLDATFDCDQTFAKGVQPLREYMGASQ
jgi:hypothetical protein